MIERYAPSLRNMGLCALLLLCDQSIEIDDLRIVVLGIALEPFAAAKMHQGLPTAGIEIVRMLMP
jgi:hypothetical protein